MQRIMASLLLLHVLLAGIGAAFGVEPPPTLVDAKAWAEWMTPMRLVHGGIPLEDAFLFFGFEHQRQLYPQSDPSAWDILVGGHPPLGHHAGTAKAGAYSPHTLRGSFTAQSDSLIFADGFENWDFLPWTRVVGARPGRNPIATQQVLECSGIELGRFELVRTTGPPNMEALEFFSTGSLCITVTAGNGSPGSAPASAVVVLKDEGVLVSTREFHGRSWQKSWTFEAPAGRNVISAWIASKPGTTLALAVYDEQLDPGEVPPGATAAPVYPEQAGRLGLPTATLSWPAGIVDEPTLIWCSEKLVGGDVELDCGPPTVFSSPVLAELPIPPDLVVQRSVQELPTLLHDGVPIPTILDATEARIIGNIWHFSTLGQALEDYVVEEIFGPITEWVEPWSTTYFYQKLDPPYPMLARKVEKGKYYRFELPKVPGTSLEICVHTIFGDADLYTDYRSLLDTSTSYYQYKSDLPDKELDCLTVPVTKAGKYYIAVYGYQESRFELTIQQSDFPESIHPGRWTIIVDAGHGKDPALAEEFLPSDCDDGNLDDDNAAVERVYNQRMLEGLMASLGHQGVPLDPDDIEVVTYDEVVLVWAAAAEGVSMRELRWRETQRAFACDGYRGLLMRRWVENSGRNHEKTVALQIHNNIYSRWKAEGSSASNYGIFGGDEDWYDSIRRSLQDGIRQRWLGRLSAASGGQGFVRGAAGYSLCGGDTPILEEDCDDPEVSSRRTAYGPGLLSAALVEVALYDLQRLYYDNVEAFETEDDFIESVGMTLAWYIENYICGKTFCYLVPPAS